MTLASRVSRALRRNERVQIESVSDLALAVGMSGAYLKQPPQQFNMPGNLSQTLLNGEFIQSPSSEWDAHVARITSNPIIGALVEKRYKTLSMVDFTFQQKNAKGIYSETSRVGSRLRLLETPWVGGTTQELMATIVIDVDACGNSYWTLMSTLLSEAALQGVPFDELPKGTPDRLVRLDPLNVFVVLGEPVTGVFYPLGFAHTHRGAMGNREVIALSPGQVAHIKPYPDPSYPWRGMSWLTKAIREVALDDVMTLHAQKYLKNGATPNMIVAYPPQLPPDQVTKFAEFFNKTYAGPDNAGKPIQIGGGVDVTVVGATFSELGFGETRGAIEARLASAAGVPPLLVGFSEALKNSSDTDYRQARDAFADGECHPFWQSVAGSFQTLFPPARQAQRLWYDTSNNPYLRNDELRVAEIFSTNAATINVLIMAGFTPETIVKAVLARDMSLLRHSGLYSVQLQEPGAEAPEDDPPDDPPLSSPGLNPPAVTGGPQ